MELPSTHTAVTTLYASNPPTSPTITIDRNFAHDLLLNIRSLMIQQNRFTTPPICGGKEIPLIMRFERIGQTAGIAEWFNEGSTEPSVVTILLSGIADEDDEPAIARMPAHGLNATKMIRELLRPQAVAYHKDDSRNQSTNFYSAESGLVGAFFGLLGATQEETPV